LLLTKRSIKVSRNLDKLIDWKKRRPNKGKKKKKEATEKIDKKRKGGKFGNIKGYNMALIRKRPKGCWKEGIRVRNGIIWGRVRASPKHREKAGGFVREIKGKKG